LTELIILGCEITILGYEIMILDFTIMTKMFAPCFSHGESTEVIRTLSHTGNLPHLKNKE
jgi:hypothetical protein